MTAIKAPLIVVDFGTATTFDVVDGDGNYRGGVIAPGINLSLQALHMAAPPSCRACAIRRTEQVIGTDTVACMQSGIYLGLYRADRGAGRAHQAGIRRPMNVVATGGLAPLFEGATPAIETIDRL